MKVTRKKNCYCHMCKKYFHYMGIASHRRKHRNRQQDCEITYTNGQTFIHHYEIIRK